MRCETCKFWADSGAGEDDREGLCRRHAPRAISVRTPSVLEAGEMYEWDSYNPAWPTTWSGEFCGEHTTKET